MSLVARSPRNAGGLMLLVPLYLISPLDIIPDFIPFAGWLDDIGVAGVALSYVMRRMEDTEDSGGRKAKGKKRSASATKKKCGKGKKK